MGEARRRGSFEERKAEGMIKNAILVEQYRVRVAELQKQQLENFNKMPPNDKQRMMLMHTMMSSVQSSLERQHVPANALQKRMNMTFDVLNSKTTDELKELLPKEALEAVSIALNTTLPVVTTEPPSDIVNEVSSEVVAA